MPNFIKCFSNVKKITSNFKWWIMIKIWINTVYNWPKLTTPPSFICIATSQSTKAVRWVFISAASVKDFISVNRFSIWNNNLGYKNAYLILLTCFCYILLDLYEVIQREGGVGEGGQISPILTNIIEISLRWHILGLSFFEHRQNRWFLLIVS